MLYLQVHLKKQLKQYEKVCITEATIAQSQSGKLLVIDELIEDGFDAMICIEIDVFEIDEISIVRTC